MSAPNAANTFWDTVDLPLPLPPATPIINGWKEIVFMPNDTGTATELTGAGYHVPDRIPATLAFGHRELMFLCGSTRTEKLSGIRSERDNNYVALTRDLLAFPTEQTQ